MGGMEAEAVPRSIRYLPDLRRLLKRSISSACGPVYCDIIDSGGSELKPNKMWNVAGDFQCSCAKAIFRRCIGLKRSESMRRGLHESRNEDCFMEVETVSEWGLKRVYCYKNAQEVAESIVHHLVDCDDGSIVADVRFVGKHGCIVITTKYHMDWHSVFGRLPCSECGMFFNGGRAVRMHQVLEHGTEYKDAQENVRCVEWQMVLYTAPSEDIAQWDEEVIRIEASRHTMHPGLEACKLGNLGDLRNLVDSRQYDPRETLDSNGSSGMCWAAGGGHIDICKYLHATCSMCVNTLRGKPGRRRHALHWAARNGHLSVMEWLLVDMRVDVDIPTEDGTTALHYAVWNNQIEAVQWLVEVGHCSIGILNSYGCNASQWCALSGNMRIATYLHNEGLDVKVLNDNGHSALHKAAMKGQLEMCEWLLLPESQGGGGLGLEHMVPDRDGFTPYRFAYDNGFYEVADAIMVRERQLLKYISREQ